MQKKVYKTTRKYKCPYCEKKYPRMDLISHVDRVHGDIIPEDYTAARVVYDSINKTDHGTCMICKKPVYEWNDKISRYNNLCGSEKCRKEVRRIALERHIKTYNAPTLLNNPEHQEKMLAHRHISGQYKHSDGGVFTYTGKYERATIEFMDKVLNIPSKDIQMPGPTLEYDYNGQTHTWITDIYYIPANLIIEVKDGGNNPNKREMPEYRGKQKAKEIMITEIGKFNYLRLTDNNFAQLLEALADIKYENMDQSTAPNLVYHINESSIHNCIHIISESTKSEIDKDFKPKERINLSSLKRVHITKDIIDRYKTKYSMLKHVRFEDTKEYKSDGYMWLDKDDVLVCHVGSCEYNDDHTKWIVSLEIYHDYKGHGLSKQILDFATKTMNCKYLSVNKNNKVAKYIYDKYGFKVYYEDNHMYYMTIDKTRLNESSSVIPKGKLIICEEVNGIPRMSSTWIEPIMMDTTFTSRLAIGNDKSDDMAIVDLVSDSFELAKQEDYFKNRDKNTGEAVVHTSLDTYDVFKDSINKAKSAYELMDSIIGHRIRSIDELALMPNWQYIDYNRFYIECALIATGIVRENMISSGTIKIVDGTDVPIKKSVLLSHSDKGYFVHTPNDFYLSSNFYDSPEDIPDNVIEIMGDIYDRKHKEGIKDGI